jgi:hypothetical protein
MSKANSHGKGDANRVTKRKQYADNFEKIFSKRKKETMTMTEMTKNYLATGDPGQKPVEWLKIGKTLASVGVPSKDELEQKIRDLKRENKE